MLPSLLYLSPTHKTQDTPDQTQGPITQEEIATLCQADYAVAYAAFPKSLLALLSLSTYTTTLIAAGRLRRVAGELTYLTQDIFVDMEARGYVGPKVRRVVYSRRPPLGSQENPIFVLDDRNELDTRLARRSSQPPPYRKGKRQRVMAQKEVTDRPQQFLVKKEKKIKNN
ncbi:hypothetical protein CVT25_007183 [Psilocybe cyanescens]|uniref:Uncharacterized protein n=1 Tax=Psilocybe cyanescens TaxID=93625 RepID=A0A409X6Z7_PSICY|nr:hypothetical protein CVT25_007183 [Psilocybe cyanescens]